jgi:hypothetical protein
VAAAGVPGHVASETMIFWTASEMLKVFSQMAEAVFICVSAFCLVALTELN